MLILISLSFLRRKMSVTFVDSHKKELSLDETNNFQSMFGFFKKPLLALRLAHSKLQELTIKFKRSVEV